MPLPKTTNKVWCIPTRYATRGFDLTLDLLLRLVAYDSVFEQLTTIQTNYLENKFKYTQGANEVLSTSLPIF